MYSRNSQMMITNVMDGCDFTSATTHLIISFIGQLRVTESILVYSAPFNVPKGSNITVTNDVSS